MARACLGLTTPLSSSLRHATHHPFTFCTPSHFLSSIAATAVPQSSSLSFHTSLEVVGGAVDKFLPAFKTLHLPYVPYPLIAWNRHVETIFAAFFRSLPEVKFRRECLRTRDDGAVSLDWVSGDDRKLPSDAPLLILLPGLSGGSGDTYVRHMLLQARGKGWRVVVFNSRGCGDSPVTTAQLYSASFLGDISEVVNHVGNCYPNANLYAIGWSLGANILVRYLGQESFTCPLAGAISLCNPFNLVIADEDFRKGFNIVYDKALANALCKIFRRHGLLFEDIGGEFNIPLAANAKSVREFDEGLTRVSFGFQSVDEYYSKSSSSDFVRNVTIPLLCIQASIVYLGNSVVYDSCDKKGISVVGLLLFIINNNLCQAENDPIAPSRGIPREDIEVYHNPQYILQVLDRTLRLTIYVGVKGCTELQPRPHGSVQRPPELGCELVISIQNNLHGHSMKLNNDLDEQFGVITRLHGRPDWKKMGRLRKAIHYHPNRIIPATRLRHSVYSEMTLEFSIFRYDSRVPQDSGQYLSAIFGNSSRDLCALVISQNIITCSIMLNFLNVQMPPRREPDHPGPTQATVVAQFRDYHVEKFSGQGDPRIVDEWIQGLEFIFEVIDCPDRYR
ncbi:esterase/lipase/thioesterase family protein, partial [Striga hermonthica]